MEEEVVSMPAHAGEPAWQTGTFHCQRCNEKVRVEKGKNIPKCPNCGGTVFDERTEERRSEEPLKGHPRK
jgi:hypothetical protein